jgi:glycosyltransferase involved in cell wall biosynthesis
MKITAFCINPLFPDQVMGGAPKHLQSVAVHLGELGHDVTVLSTRRADSDAPFRWHDRVQVLPVLPFHQPFPQPYAISGHAMAVILQEVGEHLQTADRFYMHDGEFLFPFAYQHVPTVVSLRDNVYPETLHGSFLFQGDRLILISENSRQHFLQTAGRFFPDYASRTVVIHNGVDWDHFKPTPPGKILEIIPIQPDAGPLVLHPHRPEESKGIHQTLAVVDLLVHQYGLTDVRVLVPRWLDMNLSADLRLLYKEVQIEIAQRGLTDHVIFHDWIPQSLMPQYYSLGAVTLALGSFVESFGNSVYESLGCGTPAIPARISSHREILPEHLIDKVDYGDIETAARLAADIIREKRRTPAATLSYLHEHYSVAKQRAAYADVILNAERQGPLRYRLAPIQADTRFVLPAWCYLSARGIYHDFRADYLQAPALEALLRQFSQGFTQTDAQAHGIAPETVMQWYREGYLVPSPA